MLITEIHDLSDCRAISVLSSGLSAIKESHLRKNYSPENSHINSNLFYILQHGRYSNSAYYIVEDKGRFVCSAGWNRYDNETSLVLTRAFVAPEYRATYVMAELLLPKMLESCPKTDKVWITCNEYNKTIYDWFCRSSEGKKPVLFNNWPDIYSKFVPVGVRTVYNTKQYVVQLTR